MWSWHTRTWVHDDMVEVSYRFGLAWYILVLAFFFGMFGVALYREHRTIQRNRKRIGL